MAMMKAARVHEWDGAIFIDEIPIPEPAGDQVLIRVRASSANPVDWKAWAGYIRQYLSLPLTLGWDAAGEVVALGSDVTDDTIKVGDKVVVKPASNGFAQYLAVPASKVALQAASLDDQGSAVLPTAGLTAWQGLFDHGGLQAGQKVLIQGAAGGVGHFAVQLAKWKGAYVIGTGSAGNEAFIRDLGADEFINYATTRVEDVVQDADLVLDTVGGDTLTGSYAAAKPGGIVVSIAGAHSKELAEARGVRTAGFSATATREELNAINAAVDAGHVKPVISAVYRLDQVQQVLEEVKRGHTRAKIAIQIP